MLTVNSEQWTANSELEFTMPILTDLIWPFLARGIAWRWFLKGDRVDMGYFLVSPEMNLQSHELLDNLILDFIVSWVEPTSDFPYYQ